MDFKGGPGIKDLGFIATEVFKRANEGSVCMCVCTLITNKKNHSFYRFNYYNRRVYTCVYLQM